TDTPTSTSTPSDAPTFTPTPISVIHGHLTWQSVLAANRPNVTGTLTFCVNGAPRNFGVNTDTSGNFTITTGLPDGVYHWRLKGGRHISNASPTNGADLVISGGVANQEFGTQRGGDANAPNNVDVTHFNILKNSFGQEGRLAADFDYNLVPNSGDFVILKSNFGLAGIPLTCP